jgi:hypothetical protein
LHGKAAFRPNTAVDKSTSWMLDALNQTENTVFVLSIRPYGVLEITPRIQAVDKSGIEK